MTNALTQAQRDQAIREHCAKIGRVRTAKKAASSRENGKLGGRPKAKTAPQGQE